MKIYVIYECDAYRSFDSFVLKWMTTAKTKAENFYKDHRSEYVDDRSWFFNLAYYEVTEGDSDSESNVLRELELILTTELT